VGTNLVGQRKFELVKLYSKKIFGDLEAGLVGQDSSAPEYLPGCGQALAFARDILNDKYG
jgi:hypothetical protein